VNSFSECFIITGNYLTERASLKPVIYGCECALIWANNRNEFVPYRSE